MSRCGLLFCWLVALVDVRVVGVHCVCGRFALVLDAMSWVHRLMVRVLQYFSSCAVFRFFGSGGIGHLLSLGMLVFVVSFHFAMSNTNW